MILSIEALQAKEGDCLILHYGDIDNPQMVLIDGGPKGIYKNYLRPRLLDIKQKLSPGEPLPLAMVMVSHADDDHINGIEMLTNELVDQKEGQHPPSFEIKRFWFNGFDDIIGNTEVSSFIATGSLPAPTDENTANTAAVIASTGQGRKVLSNAVTLGLPLNDPFKPLKEGHAKLVRGDTENSKVHLTENVSLHVVHPNHQRLVELQKKWDDDLKKAKEDNDPSIMVSSLISYDKSPFNLSSIVCLVEHGNLKILLTGDGRSDDIFYGLENAGLLDADGRLHVNILKMPHHGSKANMTDEFLQKITADHYVISADGKHSNPDQEVLNMFLANVTSGTLHLTNHAGKLDLKDKLDAFIQTLKNTGSDLQVSFPKDGASSKIINLLQEVDF